jgi:hypothetical protein
LFYIDTGESIQVKQSNIPNILLEIKMNVTAANKDGCTDESPDCIGKRRSDLMTAGIILTDIFIMEYDSKQRNST